MKKKKIEHYMYDNSEVDERQYQQKLKADKSVLQAFFRSIAQCYCVPFYYPFDYPMFTQVDLLVKQSENNMNKDCLKSKKTK